MRERTEAAEGGAPTGLRGWHFFVTEYGFVYRAYVFHDDGWHARQGEYATTDKADAKRVADERLRALSTPTEQQGPNPETAA